MDIKEMLSALPHSYDDFVTDTIAWMEQDENIKNAVLHQLSVNPASAPSDILKIVCEHLGMTEPLEIVDDVKEDLLITA